MREPVSKARAFLGFMLVSLAAIALLAAHAGFSRSGREEAREESARLVRRLGITDLCVFTEARYTRHPAVADLATAFQDHPLSLEHFPSGSVIPPPPHLRKHGLD